MKIRAAVSVMVAFILAVMLAAAPAMAQQVTGELGSPRATTALSGKQLLPPDPIQEEGREV